VTKANVAELTKPMGKLPFVARIFWKVFALVAILIVLTFFIFIRFTEYERTVTDTVGATISGLIFVYLVHLWLLPAEYLHPEEETDYLHDLGDHSHAADDAHGNYETRDGDAVRRFSGRPAEDLGVPADTSAAEAVSGGASSGNGASNGADAGGEESDDD